MSYNDRPLGSGADPHRVAVMGDWHANEPFALTMVAAAAAAGVEHVVHTGDFGYWPDADGSSSFLASVEAALSDAGLTLWFVDGNHENHDALLALPLEQRTGRRPVSAHIEHLPRGHRWTWSGQVWLALGGAHSMDRAARHPGVSWFWQEQLSDAEAGAAVDAGPADVVVAHDAPSRVATLRRAYAGPSWWPQVDLNAAAQHQQRLQWVADEVRPSLWLHGHHHHRYTEELTGLNGQSMIVAGLGCDDDPDGNMLLLDAPAAPQLADAAPSSPQEGP